MSCVDGFFGVVHLRPLPGDARYRAGGLEGVLASARADAAALAAGGAEGFIVENFGSAPFVKGTATDPLPPHQLAGLAIVARALRAEHAGRIGINCLRNDARAAIGIACVAGLDLVRINVHTGAYVTDQGLIEGDAHGTLAYRRQLGADGVRIWADVLVKHASPLGSLSPAQATADALDRGLADAVIVTGAGTGKQPDPVHLRAVRAAAGRRTVVIGSGLTPALAPLLAPLADAAICGTWLKRDGDVRAPVDIERVRAMASALRAAWSSRPPSG